ncbi:hypothetical protein KBAD11_09330 [Aeromonas dhakensis]|nr:binding-protein-dependent transport system inner membrane protein [Aeromonas hydrophila ML09-119]AHX31623.1 ABC transporter permease [Aeromonas hydrophila subsp. hydrophila AL09-71]AHX68419.1 ABC transporter permease [Aeromonas hydrophila pc104A]AJE37545.1 ABC transporter permease [Aeromonas hydrophila J-1]AKJ35835.1 ABC transporter permease [Aeromonas hydrophila NJ-35]ALQ64637.1 ABC transporter permease [Aeromonas hydrophila]ANB70419.1 ABC transporter permease [Aeromonas veronii]CAD74901
MRPRDGIWRLAGGLCLLGVWHLMAHRGGSLAFASPWETFQAGVNLLSDTSFWAHSLLPSLNRILAGFFLGSVLGCILGGCAGIFPALGFFLLPFRWIFSSVPGVILVILAMLWCSSDTSLVVLIVMITVIPTIYVAVQEGIAAIDRDLCEMVRVYNASLSKKLFALYLPAIAAQLLSAGIVALGGGMRVAILGETLGTSQGLGYALAVARTNLDTAQLYAVALISMLLVSMIEATCLRYLRGQLQREERT